MFKKTDDLVQEGVPQLSDEEKNILFDNSTVQPGPFPPRESFPLVTRPNGDTTCAPVSSKFHSTYSKGSSIYYVITFGGLGRSPPPYVIL